MFGRVDPDEPVIRGRDQSSRPIEVHPIAGRSVLGFAGQWMVATADIEDPNAILRIYEAAIYSFLGVDSGSIWRRVEPVGLRPPFVAARSRRLGAALRTTLVNISAFGVTLTPHRP